MSVVSERDVDEYSKQKPETYVLQVSERERKEKYERKNPPIPLDNEYNYQDVTPSPFPFHIDAPSLVFMGRLGEEPISAHFTLTNRTCKPFWFKIKVSSRELFKVRPTNGKLENSERVVIRVIFYPNVRVPKPFCEYLHVYALFAGLGDRTAYEAFNRLDRQRTLPPKRLFTEFVWHPNIGMTQAYENGKLMEMMRAKQKLLDYRKDENDKIKTFQVDFNNVIFDHRNRVLDRMLKANVVEKEKLLYMPTPNLNLYMQNLRNQKNRSKLAVLLERRGDAFKGVQNLYAEEVLAKRTGDKMFEKYKKKKGTKGYQSLDAKLYRPVKVVRNTKNKKKKGKK